MIEEGAENVTENPPFWKRLLPRRKERGVPSLPETPRLIGQVIEVPLLPTSDEDQERSAPIALAPFENAPLYLRFPTEGEGGKTVLPPDETPIPEANVLLFGDPKRSLINIQDKYQNHSYYVNHAKFFPTNEIKITHSKDGYSLKIGKKGNITGYQTGKHRFQFLQHQEVITIPLITGTIRLQTRTDSKSAQDLLEITVRGNSQGVSISIAGPDCSPNRFGQYKAGYAVAEEMQQARQQL